ncbi:PREDICTED: ribosomal RNA processing protein 1 homolog B-like [Branchiostoma belcheri]|uniref:Ribosomal RNA processing protein 1 homolog B-like n=1 Tax=Branchiostoma belcheri TaxID=7741 RepID=A0A6P4YNC1_BRABE|nr:PREDICTED: ribosomal RNA processing protein 1 homolog B-like [Branchiostoma belcheri]
MAAFGKKRGQARAPEVKFAQHLAANEKKIRDKAVKKLRQWLEARSQARGGGFEEDDMLKIWKGLFYCMWMSDKPLVQEELANTMSKLLHCLKNEDTVFLFIKVFFKTMIREWNGIDHLRMDKFFMLVRNMVSQCLEFLRQNQWDARLTDRFMTIMKEGPMSTSTEEVPNGIRYHICDIWVEELEAVGGQELSPQELLPFLTPFFMILKVSDNMTLLQSIGTSVLDEIISRADFTVPAKLQGEEEDEETEYDDDDDEEEEEEDEQQKGEDNDDDDDEVEEKATLRFDHAAIADQLFMMASQKDTRNKNRRLMYSWVKKFKDAASGIYPDQNLLQLLDSESDEDEGEHLKKKAQKKDQHVPIISTEDGHVEDVKKRKKKRKKQSQRAKKVEQSGEGKDLEMNCLSAVRGADRKQLGGKQGEAGRNAEQMLDKEHKTNGDTACDAEVGAKSVKHKKKTKGKEKTASQSEALVESTDSKLSVGTGRKKEIAKGGTKSKVKPKKRSAFQAYLDEAKEEAVESVAKVDDSCVEVVVLSGPEDSVADQSSEGKEPGKVPGEAQPSSKLPASQTKQSPKVKRRKKRYFEGAIEDSDNKEESINESSQLNSGKRQKRKSSLPDGLDEASSSPVSPKKKKKNKEHKEAFASFEKFAVTPPSFFRKAASKAMPRSEPKLKKTPKKSSSNGLPAPSSEPIEGKKRVAFALSKNTTQEFRKNEKSLAVSPAPVAIPYDSSRQPEQGVLKPSSTTPPVRRKAKRRAMAADFF